MDIKTFEVSSLQELIQKINIIGNFIGINDVVWWRGQSDSKWDLIPGIFRNKENYKNHMISHENLMFHDFKMKAYFLQNEYTHVTNFNSANWLFFMQHYGLYTRLLDWSESILVALFFVCETLEKAQKNEKDNENYKEKDGVLWVLKPRLLNKINLGYATILDDFSPQIIDLVDTIVAHKKQHKCKNKYFALTPSRIDIRHFAQFAKFTIHTSNNPLNKSKNAYKFLAKIIITKTAKKEISKFLNFVKVTKDFLCPSLDMLSKELNQRYKLIIDKIEENDKKKEYNNN